MIRVLVLYPRNGNKKFDGDYYKNIHLPQVKKRLKPVKIEADFGLPRGDVPSSYFAVTHMIFNSINELSEKYIKYGQELNEDKNRFTNIDLIFQLSEIVEI